MEQETSCEKAITTHIGGRQVNIEKPDELKRLLEDKTKHFKAGQLKHHKHRWQLITNDNTILTMISGTQIELNEHVIDKKVEGKRAIDSSYFMNTQQKAIINEEIKRLLEQGVINRSEHEDGEFISSIFTRQKSDGSHRIILNLKEFNKNIEYKKFKMETLKAAVHLVSQNCWMASIDLVSAYYCVPIERKDRKYLKFLWQGELYEYTCYSNGLAQCPRCFTKITKPVYAHLHNLGHIITGYLDDSLLIGEEKRDCLKNIGDTVGIFDELGFTVHPSKSVLKPTQEIVYLGFIINSKEMTLRLTEKRIKTFLECCEKVSSNRFNTIRHIARLIGLMVSNFPAVPYGPLYYKQLEKEKIKALKENRHNWEKNIKLSHEALTEIKWWKHTIKDAFCPISRPDPHLIIKTDASLQAWGAVCNNMKTGGAWSHEESERMHINELEMLAAFLGLKCFAKQMTKAHVQIYVDNTVAMTCLNKMGSSKSDKLNKLTKEIWEWCMERDIWISVARIAGVDNWEADYESRHVNLDTEWKLNPQILCAALKILNYTPDIDLFASRLNHQFETYMSFRPDPGAVGIDAFTVSWKHKHFYVFPPFSLLVRVLQKIKRDAATGVVVVPYWPTQTFFPILMRLLVEIPVLISTRKNLLTLPSHPSLQHHLQGKLKLLICKVSGKDIENKVFRKGLPKSSWPHGGQIRRNFTKLTLRNGKYMQLGTKWIHFHRL